MNSTHVIEVSGLRIEYGNTPAVAGIDFEVGQGEVFALLGTNGAGKTTTLDALEGYRQPTAGSVSVFGKDPVKDRDAIAPRLGIMLQDAGFFETLTVRQTVTAWRRFYRHPRSLDESLARVGLEHRADSRVGSLSGGERRRLDLALALLGHPELLFLDEPTTGMDPEGRRTSLDLVAAMVREGMTVVLTTHYLEEAEHLADRVAIMHRGTIRRMGTMTEVLRSAGDVHVTFELAPSDLSLIPDTFAPTQSRRGTATVVEIRTADQERTVRELLAWGDRHRIALTNLEIRRSSLEDLFLGLAQEAGPETSSARIPELVSRGA